MENKISKLFFWCWKIWKNKNEDLKLLKNAYELWFRKFDTSPIYGEWKSEKILSVFIKENWRKNIIISSKSNPKYINYIDIINTCFKSLKTLNTNYIDIYFIHYPCLEVSNDEVILALKYLKKKWMINNIWLSNFSLSRIKYYHTKLWDDLKYIQLYYNIWNRYAETSWIIEFCNKNNIQIMSWGSLWQWKLNILPFNIKKNCNKYNFTIFQIYLQWLLYYSNITPIIWVSNESQLIELLYIENIKMDKKVFLQLCEKVPYTNNHNNKFL